MRAAAVLAVLGGLTSEVSAQLAVIFIKRAEFTQTAGATPELNGFAFDGSAPGDGGQGILQDLLLTTPSGATRVPKYDAGIDRFVVEAHAPTAAALNQDFGPGVYTVSVTVGGFAFGGSLTLPVDSYPSAPNLLPTLWAQPLTVESEITVGWVPWPGPRVEGDVTRLRILADQVEVYVSDLEAEVDHDKVPANTLPAGKTVILQVEFRRVVTQDSTGLLPAQGIAAARTVASLLTAGELPTDVVPPVLVRSIPANGQTNLHSASSVVWQFNEPMDTNEVAVTWSSNINPALIRFSWENENRNLLATYVGNFPAGQKIEWMLNPPGNEAHFLRDRAGNRLAGAPVVGNFWIPGVPAEGCVGATAVEAARFGLFKEIHLTQADGGLPAVRSGSAARLFGFVGTPESSGDWPADLVTLQFPVPPAPPPYQLKGFAYPAPGFARFEQLFATRELMDAAYPAGTYLFQERARDVVTILNSAAVRLDSLEFPPAPRFLSASPVDGASLASGLNLAWVGLPADAVDLVAEFDVVWNEGTPDETVVFHAPDACAGRLLPRTVTSFAVPGNVFSIPGRYSVRLAHYRVVDASGRLGTKHGVTALAQVTHFALDPGGVVNPPLAGIPLETQAPERTNDVPHVITGQATIPAILQVSSDLNSWLPLAVISPIDGKLTAETEGYGFSSVFYRWRPAEPGQIPAPWVAGIVAQTNATAVVQQVVGSEGAVMTLSDAGGGYSLEIPPGALVGFETITLRLAAPTNLPTGSQPLAGVQIEPTGLHLLSPATLAISHGHALIPGEVSGLTWDWRGAETHLVPVVRGPFSANFSVSELAGYGLGVVDVRGVANWQAHMPTDPADQAAHTEALLRLRGFRPGEAAAVVGLNHLRSVFRDRIEPQFRLGASNDDRLDLALAEFDQWRSWLSFQYRVPELGAELQRGLQLGSTALIKALERAEHACDDHDLDGLRKLVKWAHVVQLPPWKDTEVGAQRKRWGYRVESCVRLDVDFTSEISAIDPRAGTGSTRIQGVLPVRYRFNIYDRLQSRFESGRLSILGSTWENVPTPCVYVRSEPQNGMGAADADLRFNLRSRHRLKPDFSQMKVRFYWFPTPDEHIKIRCPLLPLVPTLEFSVWAPGFRAVHAAKLENPGGGIYNFAGWNVVRNGALLAEKRSSASVVGSVLYRENSVLKLLHRSP